MSRPTRSRFLSTLLACSIVVVATMAGMAQAPQQTPPSSSTTAAAPVTPGDLIVDPPTLINLGFEWVIDGDGNRNAAVDVSYRKVGETEWKKGMPLLRLQNERVTQPN